MLTAPPTPSSISSAPPPLVWGWWRPWVRCWFIEQKFQKLCSNSITQSIAWLIKTKYIACNYETTWKLSICTLLWIKLTFNYGKKRKLYIFRNLPIPLTQVVSLINLKTFTLWQRESNLQYEKLKPWIIRPVPWARLFHLFLTYFNVCSYHF